jgi:MYXO-CTERM domain-containing protein
MGGFLVKIRANWLVGAALAAGAAGFAPRALGGPINSFDRGYYRNDGVHTAINHTYLTGNSGGGRYRGWFAFALPELEGEHVVGATLRMLAATVSGGPQTVTLFDVGADLGDLTTGHSAGGSGQEIFDDLGTGAVFGSRAFTGAESNQFVEYTINAAGIAAINSSLGGSLAIGARNSAEGSTNRFVYGSSGSSNAADGNVQLILDVAPVVPLPTAAGLGAAGLLALGGRRRRNRF